MLQVSKLKCDFCFFYNSEMPGFKIGRMVTSQFLLDKPLNLLASTPHLGPTAENDQPNLKL